MNFSNTKGNTYAPGKTSKVAVFTSSGSVTAGQTVSLDTSKTGEDRALYVVQGGADALIVGIALEAGTAGNPIRVCVGGYVEAIKTDGNVASGNALMGGAAGAVIPYTNASTLPIIGVALETDDATPIVDAFLFDLFPYKA